jgi:elongation factor Ts
MAVTMAEITKLRQLTGAGMMDCKNALIEANNDMEAAIEIIRKKGQAIAAKRSDREASEGCVLADANGGFAAIVALKCETDFVAKNADFIGITKSILQLALSLQPATLEELKSTTLDGRPVVDKITSFSGITGEKMELDTYEYVKGAYTVSYIHPGNKLASIVAFNKEIDYQVAREIAMQVAAMDPVAIDRESVPASIVEKELEIAREKARGEGKPENMLDKIAQGRLNKFYQEATLMEQAFIKDAKISIQQYLASVDKEVKVIAFKRVNLNLD